MAYAERIHPPLSRNMLTEELNRIRPALSRDSLPDMRESVMPALSDRLLNAPDSAPDAADAYARCARAENGAAFAGERVYADSVRFRVARERLPMRCGCVGVSAGRKRACAV